MDTKLMAGRHVLGPNGLPKTISGLDEILQSAAICIGMRKGSLPYDRELGSGFAAWYREERDGEEHPNDRALALANEGLMRLCGVRAVWGEITESGARFRVVTPLGEGEIHIGEL